ncbi:MAG: SCO family protein [Bdellovibrionota bacterium]
MSAPKNSITVIFEKPLAWLFIVLVLFAVPLYFSFTAPQPQLPPVLGHVPNFKLTNQEGREITYDTEFRGGVLLVNFIFTSCPDVCPLLSKQMEKIQTRLVTAAPIIRLASISVDPETDTPAVLKAYGEKYNARTQSWSFLTGDLMQIYDTVVGGFKVAMDNPEVDAAKKTPVVTTDANGKVVPVSKQTATMDLMEVTHGEHFVLVDQIGQIRAYMQAHNDSEINQIVKTLGLLANTNPAKAQAPQAISR